MCQSHAGRRSQCSQDCRCNRYNDLHDKLNSLLLRHSFLIFLISHSLIFRNVGAEAPSALTLVEVIIFVVPIVSVATAVASASAVGAA